MVHVGGANLEVLSATFAAAIGAALLAGVVRGFSGFGSALILSPSLAALYGPAVAVPVALLLEFALAGPFVPPALHVIDRARTGLLCVAATVTVPVGAYLLSVVDERALRWAICALVFVAVAILAFGWRYHGRPHSAATAATGGLSGLLGGSTGLSGPPVIFYELSGSAPIARVWAGAIVDMSTHSVPSPARAATPSSPSSAVSTCAPSTTIVITTSLAAPTSAGVSATVAPCSRANASARSRVWLKTVSS